MKHFRYICFTLLLFMSFNFVVRAECDDKKIANLKKQAEVISMISEYDEVGLGSGIFNNNIVTIYGLPDNFYVMNKSRSVLFSNDSSDYKNVNYGDGEFYVYSYDCPDQKLRTINVELKKYNVYYGSEDCIDYKDKIDVCSKFYDTENMSYSVFKNKLEKYKKKIGSNISEDFNLIKFIKNNIVIFLVLGFIIVAGIIALIIRNIKKNRLD